MNEELIGKGRPTGRAMLASARLESEMPRAAQPETNSDHATVLIVEDDPLIRETLGEILAEEGYRTLSARDGAEALDCLRAAALPDLIILDLMMPVMNGWEFRAEQLRDPVLARIPVIVVSGSTQPSERAVSLQPSDFISKPVNLELLLEAVARHC
jgi:CheY-like chemotaxis protein